MKRKNVKELLPIIQAYAEGKQIQFFNGGAWINLDYPNFSEEPSLYRIKPEQKYRPFNSIEECWNEMQKHQPFGWITSKNTKIKQIVDCIYDGTIRHNDVFYSFKTAFETHTFADSSPFGIKEK